MFLIAFDVRFGVYLVSLYGNMLGGESRSVALPASLQVNHAWPLFCIVGKLFFNVETQAKRCLVLWCTALHSLPE